MSPQRVSVQRCERGGGTMLVVGVMTVLLALSLAAACIAGYLVAVHRARSVADLAALSGAAAIGAGQDGCAAARGNARANNARLVSCDRVGDQIDFVITVKAEVRVDGRVPGLPSVIRSVAYAGPIGR